MPDKNDYNNCGIILWVSCAKLEAWHKMFHIFPFLQSDMMFGIVNLFWWILKAVSSDKRCPTSIPFTITCRVK